MTDAPPVTDRQTDQNSSKGGEPDQPDEGRATVSPQLLTEPPPGLLTPLHPALRWFILVAVSLAFSVALYLTHMPGALLIGPMAAAIVVATNGARLAVHRIPYIASHAMIGCIIARSLDLDTLGTVVRDWPVFLVTVSAVIAASGLLGYLLARAEILPGTTAIWGTSAGAASAMVLMAESHGADARLVAFMQYLRVAFVAGGASIVAAFVFGAAGGAATPIVWFPQTDWLDLGKTLAVAYASAAIGAWLRIPAGTMLLPMISTTLLHVLGYITLQLPEWLLALSYGVIGWKIGLSFTRRILRHAANALPQIVGSILVLMAFCGGLGWLLWYAFDIDPLTAYLATSPGGLDSIAIIAASTPVDMSFVMALQTTRLILVLLFGPAIANLVTKRVQARKA
ncbi:AbrB family transcriptional regulator [Peteryoungia desertarenae]|uniref:AbrB family transcriptional regulator n=1 Tax=Peteryoungia desertarenae TaxID=1813451 RepID=A0ABX6QNX6_9HYPH|nr:AbrB family transcriptional regulator [Peteryoungia desertarenae]QLF69945.1 AbrB family transcriptional regulator [Peteryoungia desertarenae]